MGIGAGPSAVRLVLFNNQKKSFKPIEVRDAVKSMGFAFREEQNQMAAVHGVLKRLADSNELLTKEWSKQPGLTRYLWNPDAPAPIPKALSRLIALYPALGTMQAPGLPPHLDVTAGNTSSLIAKIMGDTKPKPSLEDTINLKPKK